MDITSLKTISKRKIIMFLIVISLFAASYWIAGFSFVQVTMQNNKPAENINYGFASGQNETSLVSTSKTVKKLVRKGTYIISAKQGTYNAFSTATANGFFRTTNVNLNLISEKQASFVGDNPLSCMSLNDILISYVCNAQVDKLQAHAAATEKNASAIRKLNTDTVFGYRAAGDIQIADKSYIFGVLELDGGTELALIEVVNNQGVVSLGTLSRLVNEFSDSTEKFVIEPYKSGFIIYSPGQQMVKHYKSVSDQKPENLEVPTSTNESNIYKYSVDFLNDSSLATYSDLSVSETPNVSYKPSVPNISPDEVHDEEVFDETESSHGKATVVINPGNLSIELEHVPDQVRFCSTSFVCILSQGELTIYDIQNKPKLYLKLPNVTQIESIGDRIMMIRPDGVVDFNLSTRQGYYQYYFGEYVYCGAVFDAQRILLCVENLESSSRSSSVLVLDAKQDKTDDIDKQIDRLSKLPKIKSLAAYKNFIHISADYGELTIDPTTGDLGYGSDTIRSVNEQVLLEIQKQGIDTNKYKIVNPIR